MSAASAGAACSTQPVKCAEAPALPGIAPRRREIHPIDPRDLASPPDGLVGKGGE
jgi:hypothetical protein